MAEEKKPTNTSWSSNNSSNDPVFEDIFEHIDIDSIIIDPTTESMPNKISSSIEAKDTENKTIATTTPENKGKETNKRDKTKEKDTDKTKEKDTDKTKEKDTDKTKEKPQQKAKPKKVNKQEPTKQSTKAKKSTPTTSSETRNIKAKRASRQEVNNLNIDDISAYIASTKAQQEKQKTVLEAKDGTLLTDIPNLYAIVPHVKWDHKIVFFKDQAPEWLLDDPKQRTAGWTYIKKWITIYSVHADFKEHPTLKSKDGQPLDIWLIEKEDDLTNQLQAIQEGKWWGTNFKEPLILWKKQDSTTQIENKKEQDKTAESLAKKEESMSVKDAPENKDQNTKAAQWSQVKPKLAKQEDSWSKNTEQETPKKSTNEKKPREIELENKKSDENKKPRELKVDDKKNNDVKKPWKEENEIEIKVDKATAIKKPREDVETIKLAETKEKNVKTDKKDTSNSNKVTTEEFIIPESDEYKKQHPSKPTEQEKEKTQTTQLEEKKKQEPVPTEKKLPPNTQANIPDSAKNEKKHTPKQTQEKKSDIQQPFSNALETMREHDTFHETPPPATIQLDDLIVQDTPQPKERKTEQVANNQQEASTKQIPTSSPKKKSPEPISKKKETPLQKTPKSFDLDGMLSSPKKQETEAKESIKHEAKVEKETTPEKPLPEAKEVHPIYKEVNVSDILWEEIEEKNKHSPNEAKISNDLHTQAYDDDEDYDEDDYGEDDEHPHLWSKLAILLKIFLFLGILWWLIRFISIIFFSGSSESSTPEQVEPEEQVEEQNSNVPKVIPETPPVPNIEEDEIEEEEENEINQPEEIEEIEEIEDLETNFTLPELEAKLEAQLLESQRLLKDANFINDKRAIMFSSTARTRATSLLAEIESDPSMTANEVQDAAEKIDFYIQEASKILQ